MINFHNKLSLKRKQESRLRISHSKLGSSLLRGVHRIINLSYTDSRKVAQWYLGEEKWEWGKRETGRQTERKKKGGKGKRGRAREERCGSIKQNVFVHVRKLNHFDHTMCIFNIVLNNIHVRH